MDDATLIARGIHDAEHGLTPTGEISDLTARVIAAQLHDGQASALYALASSGAIDYPRLRTELVVTYYTPGQLPEVCRWIDVLGTYALKRVHNGETGPRPGWADLRW